MLGNISYGAAFYWTAFVDDTFTYYFGMSAVLILEKIESLFFQPTVE